jgi:cytochrome c biogenesis factor
VIPTLAETALWIALPVAIWGGALTFLGAKWSEEGLARAGEWSLVAVLALVLVGAGGLTWALLADQFELAYVHDHSSRNLEPALKVGALWAGRAGGLLTWILCLTAAAWLALLAARREGDGSAPWLAGTMLSVLAFLLAASLFLAPPFQGLEALPPGGEGLDPRLQSGWLLVHHPLVFLGFAAAFVPFARALAALVSGRLDGSWARAGRRWVRAGWLLLTAGILSGMAWAWESRGWEASWVLEPLENGTLIPWLVAGLLLQIPWARGTEGGAHTARTGPWTLGLLCLLFLSTVPAALLMTSAPSGSGLPHPGDGLVAGVFMGFVGVVGSAFLVLILWRLPAIREAAAEPPAGAEAPGTEASGTRLGGWLAHGGAAVLLVGLLGGAFATEVEEHLVPGQSATVASPLGGEYTLTYQGLSTHQERNAWHLIGLLTIRRDGRPVGSLTPERLGLFMPPAQVLRPGARSRHPVETLQAVMVELDQAVGTGNLPEHQGATFGFRVVPLAPWIWYGGVALLLGGLITVVGAMTPPRPAFPPGDEEPTLSRAGASGDRSPGRAGGPSPTSPDGAP